jgi:hypothetical protein
MSAHQTDAAAGPAATAGAAAYPRRWLAAVVMIGMYGAILGFASVLGLVLGGVLTDANLFGWSWRSTTAQQLGGALGVAVIGTIFFGQLGTHSFTQAFTHGLPVAAGLFLASAALSLLLPKTAVADEHG